MSDSVQVPEGWDDVLLGSIGTFSKGKGISKKDTSATGLSCIRYAEIYTDHDFVIKKFKSFIPPEYTGKTKQLQTNDIIFAGSGETVEDIGKSVTFIGDEEAYVGGDSVIFSPTTENDSVFLSYQLNDDIRRIQLRKYGQGSSVIHIYSSELKKVEVNLPPLFEQKKIASILTSVDDVIEKIEAQISKLQDLKIGMMTELLTTGIGHTEFEDSPVGKIPVSWEVKRLEEVADRIWIGLVTTMTKHYVDEGVPLIRNSDIKGFYFKTEGMVQLDVDFAKANESRALHKGDVATVHTGDIGTSAVVGKTLDGAQGFATLNTTVNKEIISGQFYCACLNAVFFKIQAKRVETGDGRGNLNMGDFVKLIIPVPDSISEQDNIVAIIESVNKKIVSTQQKLSHTKSLKKALMTDLLIGKVRVSTTTN